MLQKIRFSVQENAQSNVQETLNVVPMTTKTYTAQSRQIQSILQAAMNNCETFTSNNKALKQAVIIAYCCTAKASDLSITGLKQSKHVKHSGKQHQQLQHLSKPLKHTTTLTHNNPVNNVFSQYNSISLNNDQDDMPHELQPTSMVERWYQHRCHLHAVPICREINETTVWNSLSWSAPHNSGLSMNTCGQQLKAYVSEQWRTPSGATVADTPSGATVAWTPYGATVAWTPSSATVVRTPSGATVAWTPYGTTVERTPSGATGISATVASSTDVTTYLLTYLPADCTWDPSYIAANNAQWSHPLPNCWRTVTSQTWHQQSSGLI